MMTVLSTEARPALITALGGARCHNCGSMVARKLTPPYEVDCRKCNAKNQDPVAKESQTR